MTMIVEPDPVSAAALRSAVGSEAVLLDTVADAQHHLDGQASEDVVVVGPSVDGDVAYSLAEQLRLSRPTLGIVLVRRRVDTALLADAMRAGVREVVNDREIAQLAQAVHRVRDVGRRMREQAGIFDAEEASHGRFVTVFSAKGGCGKTTLSTNLAAALADGGKRKVCIVDLDLAFGDVAIAMQLFPAHTIADAVPLADTLDQEGLDALLTPHSPGLSALVAPVEPGAAETIPASLVGHLLTLLRASFDFVVVDTPPAFTDHVLSAFDHSDIIALIATLDIPALKNLKLTLETLDLLNYSREKWRIVLNRSDSKVGLSLSEVEKTLGVPISVEIPSSRDVPASINRGVPLVLDEPGHSVSQAIKDFAQQHVSSVPAAAATVIPTQLRTDRRSGLLRWRTK